MHEWSIFLDGKFLENVYSPTFDAAYLRENLIKDGYDPKIEVYYRSKKLDQKELEKTVRDLLFYIGNQREKIPTILTKLLKHLYSDRTDQQLCDIKNKILKNIK